MQSSLINKSHLPDWQRGNDSKMNPLDRVEMMYRWLKENKLSIVSDKIENDDETEIVGFVDV